MNRFTRTLSSLFALAAANLATAADEKPEHREAPVSVSSINYAENTRDELIALDTEKSKVNPVTKAVEKRPATQRYIFVPGELYESDISYEEICKHLSVVLAKKGFVNAADEQGRILEADKVDLLLRVNSGERTWRVPTARIDNITWNDGLVPRPRGRTLATLGGDVFWDQRAGGNDNAMGAAAANQNSSSFGFGSTPGTPAGASPLSTGGAIALSQAMAGNSEYEVTRNFYLIVVDAFNYQDVMKRADHARRQWTTFVAAPRQHGQKFSDALATMLKVAAPYFGETTRGLQMFTDARAHVDIGTPQVVESDVKAEEKK